ncbi:hypothetical protein BaRGS_00001094 [Batillaria attramentaria]|uniref:protein acetyllysine N-acetyltransferase n=1 Tax=Batillaria attramentaria TaxID=370345 RepID=A0ABD0M704_9CAEN
MADECLTNFGRPKRLASVRTQNAQTYAKQEIRKKLKQVSNILKKKESDRSEAERHVLNQAPDVVRAAEKNAKRLLQQKERVLEIEDDPDTLDKKCKEMARLLQSSKYAVIYSGAGISTAASIPDYRGPNGVWTLLKKGQSLRPQDLVEADPTYTHMCITKLFREGKVKYVVSQNCDGLHLRSGFPRHSLSEVHGNMFIEICKSCKPHKEYIRLFDVTERTAKGRHKTGRTCNKCSGNLSDTIVHFGEKGGLKSPYNWRQAAKAANKADLIICLGSSLKVLRCYPCLWGMDKRPQHRPKLVIVNLQWTPKDDSASLKINGRCDEVMRKVANYLGLTVPHYRRETDPLFRFHTPVSKDEELVANKKMLEQPGVKPKLQTCHRTKKVARHSKNGLPQNAPRTVSVIERTKTDSSHAAGAMGAEQSIMPGRTDHVSLDPHQMRAGVNFSNKRTAECEARLASMGVHARELNPVRLKLEKMLIERGALPKGPENGVLRHTDDYKQNHFHQDLQSLGPLPGFQSFLPEPSTQLIKQGRYPQLRSLLGSCQSQVHPSALEHDVFRVDLSTDPISITSSCSAAKLEGALAADPLMLNICLDGASLPPGCSMTEGQASSVSAKTQVESNYAKLMRNITFDHSYAKTSKRSHSSSKSGAGDLHNRTTGSDLLSPSPEVDPVCVSWQEELAPLSQYLQQSVIPLCSDVDHLSAQYNGQLFSHQELLSVVQQVMESIPAGMEYQNGQFSVLQGENPVQEERIVISLDRDSESQLQWRENIPPIQEVSCATAYSNINPWAVSTESLSSLAESEETVDVEQYERVEETEGSVESSVRDRNQTTSASVPGWFGKGLKVRRKRSL